MDGIKKELNIFRNLVDDTLYGTKQINIIAKKKYNMDKYDLGMAMACCTRNKIYNDFMDIIHFMKKDISAIERTYRLEKRIRIHINQIRKLRQKDAQKNADGLNVLLTWLKLTQIKQMSIKNTNLIYKCITSNLK
jgi:hypothetical protein